MKEDDEFEVLLGEIPRVTSSLNIQHIHNNVHHHHHHPDNLIDHGYGHASCVALTMNGHGQGLGGGRVLDHVHDMNVDESLKHYYARGSSPVSGFSLQSDGNLSSLFSSGGHSLSDVGSSSPPQIEESKPHLIPGNGFCLDFGKANKSNLVDYINLSRNFSKMYTSDVQEGVSLSPYGVQYSDHSLNGATGMSFEKYGASDCYSNGFSVRGGFNFSVPSKPVNFDGQPASALLRIQHHQRMANLLEPQCLPSQPNMPIYQSNFGNSAPGHQSYRSNVLANNNFPMGSLDNPLVGDSSFYPSGNGMNQNEARGSFYSPNMVNLTWLVPPYREENLLHHQPPMPYGRNPVPLCARVPRGRVEAFTREDGLIIQGEGTNYGMTRRACPRVHNTKSFHHESGVVRTQEKRYFPFIHPLKCSSLAEIQGYINHMARDQRGCRFLQDMFAEGTSLDVQIIFNEIIDDAVELMMNPFGNYLMQKLLEVCNEEQRLEILLRVTERPWELVRISLNTHGTRVVQKLIETIKTTQQIPIVISALKPGFVALIKDTNGNHVIQKCLACFSSEDNKYIFVAAAKYCVDIATHEHGCCVIQRCIDHSTGEHRENLIAEISANGLLLAQDPFGNYVVQFILELKIPGATFKLISQFDGNYVHLSRQKFSSHVVERCLTLCNEEVRSKIIHELLSSTCFDELLQDPHANYVIQTALRVSEAHLHNSLVDAIETHKSIARNSPYSKGVFSPKLLKRW